jgi:SSS family solute:Na+ symporter
MSTVNGLVFGNATNISNDLYRLIQPSAKPPEIVKVAKISVAAIMLICVILAWNPKTPVAELSVIAFGTIAVTIFPLWGAYFWKRATQWGAVSSTVVGVGLNLLFYIIGGKGMVLNPQSSLFELNGFLVSMIASGVVFFAVCLVTRPGETEQKSLALFFHEAMDDNGVGSSPARTVSQPGQAY